MRTIVDFAKRKWAWAGQNKLFWVNLALLVLTGVIISNARTSDFGLQLWSLALQLVGAYIVLRDLSGAAKDFGALGIIESNWRWFKWGLGIPTVVSGTANITMGVTASAGVGQARVALDPSASIEQRVANLEVFVKLVDDYAAQTVALIHAKDRELSEKIRQTRAELEQSLASTNERLKDAMIGNYSLLFFGAAWVAIGTILSTFAEDIPKLLTGYWEFNPLPFDNIDALRFRYLVAV